MLKHNMHFGQQNFGLCNSLQCHSGANSVLESDKAHHGGCWWCRGSLSRGEAGGEFGPYHPRCLCISLLSRRYQRGVEVLHRLLCTHARKGSVGVEADGCVWMVFRIYMERQEERKKERKRSLGVNFSTKQEIPQRCVSPQVRGSSRNKTGTRPDNTTFFPY